MTDAPSLARIRSLYSPLEPIATGVAPRLGPIAGIKAVLFDVYGTLLISASGDIGLVGASTRRITLGELLAEAGIAPPRPALAATDAETLVKDAIRIEHRRARARGVEHPEVDILVIWRGLLSDLGLEASPQQVRRLALEHEGRSNAVWPMPGLPETIARLRERALVLGIVSNAQFYTPLIIEAFLGRPPTALGLDPECSAWSFRLGIAKPSTAIYRPAIDGLQRVHGISPEQVLYIGNDQRNDIWPASRLGLRTALFAGDARSLRLREDDPALTGIEPDRVVTELLQVPELIG